MGTWVDILVLLQRVKSVTTEAIEVAMTPRQVFSKLNGASLFRKQSTSTLKLGQRLNFAKKLLSYEIQESPKSAEPRMRLGSGGFLRGI